MRTAVLPHAIREIENAWVPLPGTDERMAARIFLPEDAGPDNPVPVILEYLPYRKRDFTALRDTPMHTYYAGHGYASVRIDMRGSGESDGVMTDEYLAQELQDGVDAIAWLAAQPWSNGNVGMTGNSWGGFNSLQIAALRPPALKAIITSCSTDDRYTDDMHYMGGTLLTDTLDWGCTFWTLLARPPDAPLVGDRWRGMWQQRLDGLNFMVEDWLRHQRRDDVLEARLGQRGLLGHRVRGVRGRRLARWLLERDPAAPRGVVVAASRPHRPVGARLPATRDARPELRLHARGRPLLRPLAQGHRHRDHARADAAGFHAGGRAGRAVLRGLPRPLGRRDGVALAADRGATLGPRRRNPDSLASGRLLPGPARVDRRHS